MRSQSLILGLGLLGLWPSSGRAQLADTAPPDLEPNREAREALARQLLDAGMAPEQIADTVFEAIRAKRFYVFPHPHSAERIRARMEGIAAERNPVALTVDVFK